MSRRTGRCACCSRELSNSARKNTSAWKHLRKIGVSRRLSNKVARGDLW